MKPIAEQLREIASQIDSAKYGVQAADLRHIARQLELQADHLNEAILPVDTFWQQANDVKPIMLGSLCGRAKALCDNIRAAQESVADKSKAVA